jgi:hypothetical protein
MTTPANDPAESADYVDQDSEGTTQAPSGESPTDPEPIEEARDQGNDGSSIE